MYGPIAGRRHDAFMLSESGLQSKLATVTKEDESMYVIYGIWGVKNNLGPLSWHSIDTTTRSFQPSNEPCESVSGVDFWKNSHSYLDNKRSNKVLLQPNCKILSGGSPVDQLSYMFVLSQTSTFFNVNPPSLDTYLSNMRNSCIHVK